MLYKVSLSIFAWKGPGGPQKLMGKETALPSYPAATLCHPTQNYRSRRDSDTWMEAAGTRSLGAPCFVGDSRDGALTLPKCFIGLVLERLSTASPRKGLLERILPGEQCQRDKGKATARLKCLKEEHPCSQAAETQKIV